MLRLVLRVVVASTLVGAAVIHAAQAPSHLAEWWAAGVTFVGLAAAQAVLGAAAAVWADRWVWQLAQAVSLATIGLWILSRTVGLPGGPEAGLPEPLGRADLVATGLETATVLAASLLLWPGVGANGCRRGWSAAAVAVAIAVLTGAVAWYGVQPTSVCDNHDAAQAQLGPLAPVEGHSLLAAATPIATADPRQRVGLVVGLLRNCATAPITVQAARVLNQDGEGHTITTGRFWVISAPPAQPGIVLPAGQLSGGQPLPGRVTVQPTPEAPTHALVLELHTRRPGGFRVDALTVSYQSGGRSYTAPFATNAQLTIGQHHQAAQRKPAEAITHASLAALIVRPPSSAPRTTRSWPRRRSDAPTEPPRSNDLSTLPKPHKPKPDHPRSQLAPGSFPRAGRAIWDPCCMRRNVWEAAVVA
jgi:hypothetical protein